MRYRLFIDDIRHPPIRSQAGEWNNNWIVARSSEQALDIIQTFGLPFFISFDHDLGGNDNAMIFLKNLSEYMADSALYFPKNFTYGVHSHNPVGKGNIEGFMDQFMKTRGA